ncbi:AAA family ATPase [Priestia megaterium]|uniref:AAA family ATPase n=1 Tax=Priestia megaterium TaxID=1404 RepID=UPI00300AE73A
MEILYLWIDNYQNGTINKQGFNFSSQYRFQYDPLNGQLNIKENPYYLENFFCDENQNNLSFGWIENITAIIGENGTGKSTILEFIKDVLAIHGGKKTFRGKELQAIIALQHPITREKLVYYHQGLKITKGNYSQYGVKLVPFVNENNDGYWSRKTIVPEMSSSTIIFFSNIFDAKKVFDPLQKIINISTNYLIREDIGYIFTETSLSESLMHRYKEVERQIDFIIQSSLINDFGNEIPIPQEVEIILGDEVQLQEKIEGSKDNFGSFIKWLVEELRKGEGYEFERDVSSRPEFRRSFYVAMVQHLYAEFQGASSDLRRKIGEWLAPLETSYDKIYEHVYLVLQELLSKFQEFVKENRIYYKKTAKLSRSQVYKGKRYKGGWNTKPIDFTLVVHAQYARNLIENMRNFLTFIDDCLQKEWIEAEDFDTIFVEFKAENPWTFQNLYSLYKKTYRNHPYLNFDWSDLSSGQKALLNLFSRFYTTVNPKDYRSKSVRDHLIILIDEGELYLHPQWQKKLIQILIRFLTRLYPGKRIQLILTSNSPFLVSDLPSSNVIFLQKDAHGTQVVDGLEDHKQTFASNIHTLLAHSFFVKNGLIGSFAKDKINNLANLLINGSEREVKSRREEIEKTIQVIGEPLIKDQLLKELEARVKVKMLTLEEEIELLKKRLSVLEGEDK